MQVNRHNLSLVLQDFKRDLAKCDFVAMDQEMCGIQRQGKEPLRSMTPVEAWQAPFFAARSYIAFQCGLCLCRIKRDNTTTSTAAAAAPSSSAAAAAAVAAPTADIDGPVSPTSPGSAPPPPPVPPSAAAAATTSIPLAGSTNRLELKPYNFWLRQHGRSAPDVQLNMDTIDFLARNGMDFNTWLRDGMEYLGATGAEATRARLLPRGYPSSANAAACMFAKYVKHIVIEQWYKGGAVDLSVSFLDFCQAAKQHCKTPATDSASVEQSKQTQQSKKQSKKQQQQQQQEQQQQQSEDGDCCASLLADVEASRRLTATRRILAGCRSGAATPTPPRSPSLGGVNTPPAISSPIVLPSSPGPSLPATPPQLDGTTTTTATAAASSQFESQQHVLVVAASPDGTSVAGGTVRGCVKVWNVLTMHHMATLAPSSTAAAAAAATAAVTAGDDRTPSSVAVTAISFHPNSAFLAAGNASGAVAIWELSTATQVQSILALPASASSPVAALHFDDRGLNLALATRGGTLAVWDVVRAAFATPPLPSVTQKAEEVSFMQYSADGSKILVGVSVRGGCGSIVEQPPGILAFNATTLENVSASSRFQLPVELLALAKAQNRQLAASTNNNNNNNNNNNGGSPTLGGPFFVVSQNGRVCALANVADPTTGTTFATANAAATTPSGASATATAASPTGPPLPAATAVAIVDCDVGRILTKQEQKELKGGGAADAARHLRFLVGHSAPVTSVKFSADGTRVLTSSVYDGTVRLFDAATSTAAAGSSCDGSSDMDSPLRGDRSGAAAASPAITLAPIIVLQQGPRIAASPVAVSALDKSLRFNGIAAPAPAACRSSTTVAPSPVPSAVCFSARSNALASCSCADGDVSVWELHRGVFGGGVVSISLDSVCVQLPDKAASELPAMFLTDLLLAKAEVELESNKKQVGNRCSFRRRGPGYHEQLVRKHHEELTDKLGFRLFFEALKESKKPLVGHHFQSDLAFFVNQHECGIREDFAWFKKTVHELFPSIYDTKSFAAATTTAHQNLEDLFNKRQGGKHAVEMHLPMPFLSYHPSTRSAEAVAHNAAYDAMLTACVFYSFVCESPSMLSDMENQVSFFGINYWCTYGSNYDTIAWCQVLTVSGVPPGTAVSFSNEAHIRQVLEAAGVLVAVEAVPGASIQFVRHGSGSFQILIRPHVSATVLEQLRARLARGGFETKLWKGQVSSVSQSAAQQMAGKAEDAAAGKLSKKQKRQQHAQQQALAAQQQQRSRGASTSSRPGADSAASSQFGDDDE